MGKIAQIQHRGTSFVVSPCTMWHCANSSRLNCILRVACVAVVYFIFSHWASPPLIQTLLRHTHTNKNGYASMCIYSFDVSSPRLIICRTLLFWCPMRSQYVLRGFLSYFCALFSHIALESPESHHEHIHTHFHIYVLYPLYRCT
jgi:hypothetical protein